MAQAVVGEVAARIFGQQDAMTTAYAHKLGLAFQLTNIIRDVKTDLDKGRIYLPQEDLRRFGVTEAALAAGQRTNCACTASSVIRNSLRAISLIVRCTLAEKSIVRTAPVEISSRRRCPPSASIWVHRHVVLVIARRCRGRRRDGELHVICE